MFGRVAATTCILDVHAKKKYGFRLAIACFSHIHIFNSSYIYVLVNLRRASGAAAGMCGGRREAGAARSGGDVLDGISGPILITTTKNGKLKAQFKILSFRVMN